MLKFSFSSINPQLKKLFDNESLSEETFNVNVQKVPPGGGGFAYYQFPSIDNRRVGTYFINVNNIEKLTKHDAAALTLHEANPGHNLEIVFSLKISPNPAYLKYLTYDWAIPGVPVNYNAFREGWALYSEYLGFEMGIYNDPYAKIGFYSGNLLRAARLVVDTGLHAFGWSRNRAIEYLVDNTLFSRSFAEQQIDR